MPVYYLDTSALVKRYVSEVGSAWVHQAADPSQRNALYTSRLTAVELTAAVVRRARGAGIPAADLQATLAAFGGDWSTEYRVIEVTVALVDRAVALAEQYAIRGYDALHLATALVVNDSTIAQG